MHSGEARSRCTALAADSRSMDLTRPSSGKRTVSKTTACHISATSKHSHDGGVLVITLVGDWMVAWPCNNSGRRPVRRDETAATPRQIHAAAGCSERCATLTVPTTVHCRPWTIQGRVPATFTAAHHSHRAHAAADGWICRGRRAWQRQSGTQGGGRDKFVLRLSAAFAVHH